MDITYIPMARGFVYLVLVTGLGESSRAQVAPVDHDGHGLCLEALDEALARYGAPAILNTRHGSQFTSAAFTGCLLQHGIRISIDGRGCWRDNVFVERPWRRLKYEEVYLHVYDSVSHATTRIGRYLTFYHTRGPHRQLQDRAPVDAYFTKSRPALAA